MINKKKEETKNTLDNSLGETPQGCKYSQPCVLFGRMCYELYTPREK